MPGYTLVLFVHVVAAMILIGALSRLMLLERVGFQSQTPAELRAVQEKSERIAVAMKSLVPVLLVTGLYMAWSAWSLSASWVIAALLAFVYLAATGPALFGRRMRQAADLASVEGSITPEVRRLLHDPLLVTMGHIRIALFALLVFLMTNKPGLAGSIGATIAAVVLGAASGMRFSPARVTTEPSRG